MNEFLKRPTAEAPVEEDLSVQKAVVESLAADKAEQDERICSLQRENNVLKGEIASLKAFVEELKAKLANVGDVLAANAEGTTSNKISLIDRDPELNDRFEGETRDHVLEVIAEAREKAEQEGRRRRAQVLEGVLLANVPSGILAKKRQKLVQFFNENGNILSGPVIAELEKEGISHKNGETYLLADEIIKRQY